MRRDLLLLLDDIHECGSDILRFTAGKDEEAYLGSLLLRRAVERSFEIIGEASHQCQYHFPGALDSIFGIPAMIAFRNRLAHEYSVIENDAVWALIRDDLPPMITQVKALMDSLAGT